MVLFYLVLSVECGIVLGCLDFIVAVIVVGLFVLGAFLSLLDD